MRDGDLNVDGELDDDTMEGWTQEELEESDRLVSVRLLNLYRLGEPEHRGHGTDSSKRDRIPGQSPSELELVRKVREWGSALTADSLADLLSLSKQHIYRLAKAGRVPHYRLGGAIRFDPGATADWIEVKFCA